MAATKIGVPTYELGLQKKKSLRDSSKVLPWKNNELKGKQVVLREQITSTRRNRNGASNFSIHAQNSVCIHRTMRWWEKDIKVNMKKIQSAEDLVTSLLSAGDKLVVVEFYSPGCGGCRALHPKLCQLADVNQEALFLTVNYEELRVMCCSLHVQVLPLFRFYRGAQGRVCSFSCTNATIDKLKNALGKHVIDHSSIGPAKGLEQSELMSLASNRQIYI